MIEKAKRKELQMVRNVLKEELQKEKGDIASHLMYENRLKEIEKGKCKGKIKIHGVLLSRVKTKVTKEDKEMCDMDILDEEMEVAISQLNKGQSPGAD